MEEVQPDLFPRVFQLTEELLAWNAVDTKLDTISCKGINPRPLLGQTTADVDYTLEPATYLIPKISWIKFWEKSTNCTRGECSYVGCTNKPLLEDTYGSKVRVMATRIATLPPYAADATIGKV